jgi:predicted lipid-binding transport protein (Tim44 family)
MNRCHIKARMNSLFFDNGSSMKKLMGFFLSVLIGLTLTLSGFEDAYAKRMGGGKSFGSKPSYGESYKRSTDAGQPSSSFQQPAYQSAAQRNQSLRDSFSRRGGLMGMLGGLALGGLLGAMLFGGAFENINFLDILLLGLVAFMLFKLFAARRRAAAEPDAAPAGAYPAGYAPTPDINDSDRAYERRGDFAQSGPAGFDTDVLFNKGDRPRSPSERFESREGTASLPSDFDVPAFLGGAKAAYEMMQKAWDAGDLAELRALTTDQVFGELQDQLRERGREANRTELLKLELELLEVVDVGSDREAVVLFDVLMRESPQDEPQQVREVWRFVRPKHSRQPTWFLDGIQQVED